MEDYKSGKQRNHLLDGKGKVLRKISAQITNNQTRPIQLQMSSEETSFLSIQLQLKKQ